jgi:nucleotide-binding universal stress UspA family protein
MENLSIKPIASNNILVPVDFSAVADTAINHATLLAKILKKEISLLHVVESGLLTSGKSLEQKEEEARQKLAVLSEKIQKESGIASHIVTRRGNIFETIGEVADELNSAFVVMGTHGVKGIQHVVGSRALKVINNANRAFVVVQNKPIRDYGYKNIILPIDFSRETKQKLVWAAELSKIFDSTFHIFADYESDEYAANAVKNNIAYAENYLSTRNCKFTVNKRSKDDNFTKATIQFAAANDADLIIIMTSQEKDLGDYIVGPYEQNVIANDAQIPVMTLNPVDNMQILGGIIFQ